VVVAVDVGGSKRPKALPCWGLRVVQPRVMRRVARIGDHTILCCGSKHEKQQQQQPRALQLKSTLALSCISTCRNSMPFTP
jgi:hypothetical protein